jgi:hypothetical protein
MLYHAFSRRSGREKAPGNSNARNHSMASALSVLQEILTSGLLLTREVIPIRWDDPYGHLTTDQIQITQYRFCLTALNGDEDILQHSMQFGPIALGFSSDFVRKALGGTPVFYLPSPILTTAILGEVRDDIGVSLMYRLAEIRGMLEGIETLPPKHRAEVTKGVADFHNALGAVRFLGNILYLTDRLRVDDTEDLRYYRQREWRVIAGLCPMQVITREVKYGKQTAYLITSALAEPIHRFIDEVTVVGAEADKADVSKHFREAGLNPAIRLIRG